MSFIDKLKQTFFGEDFNATSASKEYDFVLLLIRIAAAVFMMTHGYPKLEKLVAGGEIKFYNFMWTGPTISLALCVVGELVAPLFIILGYRFKLATVLIVYTMFIAAFGAHFGDPFSEKEHSLIYFLLFILLNQTGPGKFSLGYFLSKK